MAQHGKLHPVQKAWLDLDVPQCGYCQSGMMMAAAALLKQKPKPTDARGDHQYLPLRHLSAHPRRHPCRRQCVTSRCEDAHYQSPPAVGLGRRRGGPRGRIGSRAGRSAAGGAAAF
jgi:aerobic-type carbon monoxide dehydrogenase small subunit (CoxS/CutS family)